MTVGPGKAALGKSVWSGRAITVMPTQIGLSLAVGAGSQRRDVGGPGDGRHWIRVSARERCNSGERRGDMVTAFVLINSKRDKIVGTAEALSGLEGVSEVYSVAGQYDIVAVMRVKTNEQMAELVTGKMLKMPGIERSTTIIAFRTYSKFDLERMFAIGT